MNAKATEGERMLIERKDKYSLDLVYAPETKFIGLTLYEECEDGTLEVVTDLDLSSIFEQVADAIKANEREYYCFLWKNDEKSSFSGTPEDVAHWYCQHEGIKLFIENSANDTASYALYAIFPDSKSDEYTCIAAFEARPHDIETAYELFFSEYLAENQEKGKYTLMTEYEYDRMIVNRERMRNTRNEEDTPF